MLRILTLIAALNTSCATAPAKPGFDLEYCYAVVENRDSYAIEAPENRDLDVCTGIVLLDSPDYFKGE